ncbi:MAG: RNA methyltransferase [Prevotellaceae bacterium]|nr:RNA methyltransferase [Prevotellaceae bacterium]
MISKSLVRTIKSLEGRKCRLKEGLFLAEGGKLVGELMPSFTLHRVICLEGWAERNAALLPPGVTPVIVSPEELRRASLQQHPQEVIAIFSLPRWQERLEDVATHELTLALDCVQDPGNLGTIVRLADWFGLRRVFCSTDTADVFSPKAVQATMGALARVRVQYIDLEAQLRAFGGDIYGTFLSGEDIYSAELGGTGVILLGNEGRGIRPGLSRLVSRRLVIPPYPAQSPTVESLNVAMAAAIVCAEFRRRQRP